MQPTYLPWAGYFHLIGTVDKFVFLDDVQYERRSWQSRNRILLQDREHYLTVPVRKAPRSELIKNILIDNDQDWRTHHLQLLRHAYLKAAAGRDVLDLVENVFRRNHTYLAELNEDLISALARYIGLQTPLLRASDLGCGARRGDHLAEVCHAIGCSYYLSPEGSREYLTRDCFAEKSGVRLSFQNYTAFPYPQRGAATFVSHLSIVDVLATHGPEFTRSYVLQCK